MLKVNIPKRPYNRYLYGTKTLVEIMYDLGFRTYEDGMARYNTVEKKLVEPIEVYKFTYEGKPLNFTLHVV